MVALGIDVETVIMFLTTLFFTALFLIVRGKGFQLFFGALTVICWFFMGIVYIASGATFSPIALLFVTIGLCFMTFVIFIAFTKSKETDMSDFEGI